MKLINKIKSLQASEPTTRAHEVEVNKKKFNLDELETKAKLGQAMTSDEYAALQKHKNEELSNRILRIAGLGFILVLVTLAVGCFLYPYSILNLFGKGNRFWNCWDQVRYSLSGDAVQKYFTIMRDSLDWGDPATLVKYGSREIYENYFIESHNISVSATNEWMSGWLNLSEIMEIAFLPGTGAKCAFIAVGSWSIVVLSTIGLVGIIIYAAYAVAYNVKDLIGLIAHLIRGTKYVINDVSATVKDNVEESIENEQKKSQQSQPKKKKPKIVKTEEPKEDDYEDDAEIIKKVEQYKAEMEEVAKPQQPATQPQSQNKTLNDLSDADLNSLLR